MTEPSIRAVVTECLKGKSLVGSLSDLRCGSVELSGSGLDIGAKLRESSYHGFLSIKPGTSITGIDLNPSAEGLVQANVEEAIPLPSESQDFVLAMNVLEHLFEYRVCIRECFRVLKPSGNLIGVVPFLKNVHPDREDYFRFTAPALERLFRETGFRDIAVESLGFGPVTAAVSQMAHLLGSRVLATGLWTVAILTDKSLRTLFRNARGTSPTTYPLSLSQKWKLQIGGAERSQRVR